MARPSHNLDSPFRRFQRGFDRVALASLAFLGVVAGGACVHTGTGHWYLGSRLDHERVIVLEPRFDDETALELDLGAGDFKIVRSDGATRLVATVMEEVPGATELFFEDGELIVATPADEGSMVTEILLELGHDLRSIEIDMGAGELSIEGVHVRGHVTVSAGAGDISIEDIGSLGQVEVGLGAGDLSLADFEAERVLIDQGAGDVRLDGVTARLVEIDSGIGSVTLRRCRIDDLRADAGIGDITATSCDIERHTIDAGIGSIHLDD